MRALLDSTLRRGSGICVPVGAVAQTWRSGRQAHLARLLRSFDVDFAVLTLAGARLVGLVCAASGSDVVDVHVVLCAQERNHAVVTSDPDDLARVDPTLPLIRI